MQPAAAISQNQNGREISDGAADLPLELEDEPELPEELPEEPVDVAEDEPEVEVAVAATRAAAAAAFTAASVDVTFISKLLTSNVTLLVACQVSDPNWMRPRNASLSIKLWAVR